MKIEKKLEDSIRTIMNPRKPLHFSKVKIFIANVNNEWVENCRGVLIFHMKETFYHFAVMNIMKFQIDFDMEIYSNFLSSKWTKFVGENCCMHFIIPVHGRCLSAIAILESKEELNLLKRALEKEFHKIDESEDLDFFSRPEVEPFILKAEIKFERLENIPSLRKDAESAINNFFKEVEDLERKTKISGFKAYGLGREEWKHEETEKEYLKEQKKEELILELRRIDKQSKAVNP